jgi:hypothetical protein
MFLAYWHWTTNLLNRGSGGWYQMTISRLIEELGRFAEHGYAIVASSLEAQALCELSGLRDTV